MADGLKPGVIMQVSSNELPAAATAINPEFTMVSIASPTARSTSRPAKLMLTTAGRSVLIDTQSIAAMTHDHSPPPRSLRALTPLTLAAGATPNVLPAAVPAQCVPWPWPSRAQLWAPLHSTRLPLFDPKSTAGLARLPNSSCVTRTPVSITKTVTPTPVVLRLSAPMRSRAHVAACTPTSLVVSMRASSIWNGWSAST